MIGPFASPFKISKNMLPKPYRHPCDPNHAEYPKKCEENKARVRLEKVKKREFFCKVYKICIEYSEGTLMLNVHQFWRARELVPHYQSSLPFPTRTIHDIVRHWHGADRSNPLWWQPHHYAKLATTTIDPIM
ncbi:unnamed protein product [Auanema sp. JU1783]|nr:unnamed protein product [Auanema sp. JU1783]